MTEIILYLIQIDDKIVLTDNGNTYAYLDNIFELDEPAIIKDISAVSNYYGVILENRQLIIEVNSIEKISEEFLKMFYCIGFLNDMVIFY